MTLTEFPGVMYSKMVVGVKDAQNVQDNIQKSHFIMYQAKGSVWNIPFTPNAVQPLQRQRNQCYP